MSRGVAVTGSNGYLGRQVVAALAVAPEIGPVIGIDLRLPDVPIAGVEYMAGDVRDPGLSTVLSERRVDTVVHLAAIVSPGRKPDRELEYSVDVLGTRNILEACHAAGVQSLIVTSSGAAYGYYADQPERLTEDDRIRGNETFAYAYHKRLVEEMLAEWRRQEPGLSQLIFRPGTILGADAANQITALFERRVILGLRGTDIPFVFIWDQDVVQCILKGIRDESTGIFNLAGDGVMTMAQIAAALDKPLVRLPVWLVRAALAVLRALRLTQYGPEQVDFLRYRPVLDNTRLKNEFGYTPTLNSAEVFARYRSSRDD
jgi:UDP-glucose 4-epimerase